MVYETTREWGRAALNAQRGLALLVLMGLAMYVAPTAWAQGSPSISMKVDRQTMSLEEELTLEISVSGATELASPDLSQFEILGQSSQTSINVGRSRSVTQTLLLRPRSAGTLTIGKAQALVNGQLVAEAPAITVTVTAPKPPDPVSASEALDLERLAKDPVFLRWELPRTTFYVSEPFPIVLQLWVRTELNVHNPEFVQNPKLDGLLVEDLKVDAARSAERKTLGGAQFDVFPLVAQIATPLKAGRVLIDTASMRIPVSEGGFLAQTKRVLRSTSPFHLDIADVPTEGRPEGFSPRNVGTFSLTAKLLDDRATEATRVKTGQRLVLRAEVSGRGNLQLLEAPQLATSNDFEITPLSGGSEDRVEKSLTGMSGTRVFQWLVAAKKPGNLVSPTLELDFWDPVDKRFQSVKVEGRTLEATGAPVSAEVDQASAIGEDVGPIVEQTTLRSEKPSSVPRDPLYLVALGVPFFLWLTFEIRHRRDRRDRQNPHLKATRGALGNARKRLKAAEQALRDGLVKDFYGQLARTLSGYLEERANIPATGMTHGEVRQAARTAGYDGAIIDRWVVEMENCDFARFAPSGSAAEKMREAADRVGRLIDDLDKVTPTRRP